MPRLVLCAAALTAALLSLASCGGHEPPWKKLRTSSGQSYEVSVKTFKDGAYADQPFHLRIVSKRSPEDELKVLAAQQCKNVKVLQRPDYLYVFYEELGVNDFSTDQVVGSMPRPFLCPLQHEFCRNVLRTAEFGGEIVSAVCTSS